MAIVRRRRKRGVTYAAVIRADGKQVWRTFSTRDAAKRWESQAMVSRGSGWIGRRIAFGQYIDEWLDATKASLIKGTVANYRCACARAKAALGGVVLEKLRAGQIQAHLGALLIRGLSSSYVATDAKILAAALNKAVLWGYIQRSPMAGVSRPRAERREFKVFDEEQARLFLARAERESPYFCVYLTAITTGMRISEILNARWGDVDLVAKTLSVRRSKTRAGVRRVDLPDVLVRRLMDRPKGTADEPVFLGARANDIRKDLKRFTDARFHDLRHSHATMGIRAGVHPKVMADRLGHSRISVTIDTYSHVLPGMGRQVAQAMDDILGGR